MNHQENLNTAASDLNPTLQLGGSYREPFSFRNSPEAITRFPFPFPTDQYMYSVNIEPHRKGLHKSVYEYAFDIDEHYLTEMEDRRKVLQSDPGRYVALPHMKWAQWDTLELLMESLSQDYPQHFFLNKVSLDKIGDQWTWTNHLLKQSDTFIFGQDHTLPCDPFEYITRQVQGDFVIMDHRDENLFADAGMVTGPADWTMAFDAGMTFKEWHGPVPLAHEIGVFDRALKYLLNLRVGGPVRRLNWTMTIHPRLDTSPETYAKWVSDRTQVNMQNVGELAHLRVEVQALFRLPRSNGILFSIRTYLIRLDELVTQPEWAQRLKNVFTNLHEELIAYKGLGRYRETVIEWLTQFKA